MVDNKQRVVTLGNQKFLVINLCQPLKENTKVFPGDPQPIKETFTDIRQTGYHHYVWKIGDHHFQPHGDAPNHQNPELLDKGFESFGSDYLFNSACLIDLSNSSQAEELAGIKYLVEIKKEHLEHFTSLLSQKSAAIIRTGYDKWLEANKPHNLRKIPYLSKEAGDFLKQFSNLRVIGIDSLTVDALRSQYVHKLFKDKLIVESLVNLHGIPSGNRNNFDLQTAPIAIVGATGGPIAAFAFIKINQK